MKPGVAFQNRPLTPSGTNKPPRLTSENIRDAVKAYLHRANQATQYIHIGQWDVSDVKDMNQLFANMSTFNEDISKWKTHNVTNMDSMFHGCRSFNNGANETRPHSLEWDTSNVTNMDGMFALCNRMNCPLSFTTNKVTTMTRMFYYCTNFDQDVSSWNLDSLQNPFRCFMDVK